MSVRIPFEMPAEYRGREPGREYVEKETGEVKRSADKLQFEVEEPDGSLGLIGFSATQIEKADGGSVGLVAAVSRGDQFVLTGRAVIADRREDSYVQLKAIASAARGQQSSGPESAKKAA